ncbi:Mss4-like protein [Xylariaceae sp. FL1019]|nr:Mss4-like protein [Xylariaceae sp. FL1019]
MDCLTDKQQKACTYFLLGDIMAMTTQCHCGRIKIEIPSIPKVLNDCRCTLCYKLGGLWAYYPRDTVHISNCSPSSPLSPMPQDDERREIKTANDEALRSYTRADIPPGPEAHREGPLSGYRCAHCGALTHWWRQNNDESAKMGVNCRLLTEGEIEGIEVEINRI